MSNRRTSQVQNVFTQSDLNVAARNLLFRMKAELFDFDGRPPVYKPRWKLTKTGAALLIHRKIEAMDAARYGYNVNAAFENVDDVDVDVDGGAA